MKTKTIPFDVETAKKIQAGKIEGKIKTREGEKVRIICWDRKDSELRTVLLIQYEDWEGLHECNTKGEYIKGSGDYTSLGNLTLEVPDDEPQFKPFDKVLVRDRDDLKWRADIFSHIYKEFYMCIGGAWKQCIPYKGNEHLLGTTDKPKEAHNESKTKK